MNQRALVVLASVCLLNGCSRPAPTTDSDASAVEAQRLPEPKPMSTRPLGVPPWTAIAATHERDGLLVGMPRALRRMDAAGVKVVWEARLDEQAAFVAISGDGTRAAALVRLEDAADYQMIVVDAKTGAPLESPRFELPSPPERERGIEQPTHPTGLSGQPGGSGFWVANPYGTWLVAAGHLDRSAAVEVAGFGGAHAAQDGSGAWTAARAGLARIDASGQRQPEVDLGCYPQRFVVDPGIDRAVTLCSQQQKNSVRLHALSSGDKLAEWLTRGWPSFALLGADELWILEDNPGAIARLRGGEVERRPQSVGWGGLQISPSGKTLLARGDGIVQALDIDSGDVRCTLEAAAWGAGLEDDDTAWILGLSPDVFNALQLQRADLATCALGAARALDIGKTTNLGAIWLPAPKVFALNALYGKGSYGPTLVGVDGGVEHLRSGATPALSGSPDGKHLALVESERATLFDLSGGEPRELGTIPEAAKVALCDDFALAYMWNKGWVAHGYDGQPPKAASGRFAPQPQVDTATCRGGTLVVGRVNGWFVLDPASGRFVAHWDHGHRVGALALAPDGRGAVLSGGLTGLQQSSIR